MSDGMNQEDAASPGGDAVDLNTLATSEGTSRRPALQDHDSDDMADAGDYAILRGADSEDFVMVPRFTMEEDGNSTTSANSSVTNKAGGPTCAGPEPPGVADPAASAIAVAAQQRMASDTEVVREMDQEMPDAAAAPAVATATGGGVDNASQTGMETTTTAPLQPTTSAPWPEEEKGRYAGLGFYRHTMEQRAHDDWHTTKRKSAMTAGDHGKCSKNVLKDYGRKGHGNAGGSSSVSDARGDARGEVPSFDTVMQRCSPSSSLARCSSAATFAYASTRDSRAQSLTVAPVPSSAPPLPPHYVERSALTDTAVAALTMTSFDCFRDGDRANIPYVLFGKSGTGKTVLASAIIRRPEVRRRFRRGIYWLGARSSGTGRIACKGRLVDTLCALAAEIMMSPPCGSSAAPVRHGKRPDGTGSGSGDNYNVDGRRESSSNDNGSTAGKGSAVDSTSSVRTEIFIAEATPPPSRTLDTQAEEMIRWMAQANSRYVMHPRLVVLDDVWDVDIMTALRVAGFVLLVTTSATAPGVGREGKSAGGDGGGNGSGQEQEPRLTEICAVGRKLSGPSHFSHTRIACLAHASGDLVVGLKLAGGISDERVMRILGMTPKEAAALFASRNQGGHPEQQQDESAAETGAGEQVHEGGGSAPAHCPVPSSAQPCSFEADGEELANPCCQSNPLALVIASSLDAMNGVDLRKDRVKVAQIDQQLIGRGGDGQQEAHGRHPDAEAHPRGLFTALGRDCRLRGLLNFSLGELDHTSRGCFIHLGVISSRVLVPLDMLSHLWEQTTEQAALTAKKLTTKCLLMEEHLDPDRTKSCSYSWYRLHEPLQAYAKAQLRRSSPSTVEAVTLRQAAYVGNVGMLSISSPVALPSSSSSSPSMSNLSYSDRGHPSNLNDDIRGDLEYLACLWRSVEDVRAADVGNDTGALLSCATYMPALKDMGVCSKAAAGYWAAAKLLLLHGKLADATMLSDMAVTTGSSLYSSEADNARRRSEDVCLLRVQQGGEGEVVRVYECWLEDARARNGADHPAIAAVLSAFAGLLVEQEKLESARRRYEEALRILEHALGPDHPQLASTLIDLAGLQAKTASLAVTTGLCCRALAIYDHVLGWRDSRGAATSLVRLADMLILVGKLEEAERLCRRALAILERELGLHHVQVGSVYATLASILSQQRKHDDAVKQYRQAIRVGQLTIGPSHEKVAVWRSQMAASLTKQKSYIDATAHYLQVVSLCQHQPSVDQQAIVQEANERLNELVHLVKYDDLTAWMAKTGEEKGVEGPSTDRKKDEGDSTRLAVSDASLSTKETGSASSAEHGRQADHQKCGEQQQNEGENKPESGSDCSEDLENTEDRHWRTVAVLHLHAHHPITISRVMEDIEAEESMLDEAIALSLEEARRGEAAADVPCFTEVD